LRYIKHYTQKIQTPQRIPFIKSERYEAAQESARETAKRMIKAGKMSLEDIADYTELSFETVKELESQTMQLT